MQTGKVDPSGLSGPRPFRQIGRRHPRLGLEAINLAAYRETVVEAGLTVPPIEVFDGGMKHFALEDPDGLRLDFFQGRDGYEAFIAGNSQAIGAST